MKRIKYLGFLVCSLSVIGLIACGGGGGGSTNTTTGTTSIKSVGTITGFGSVYVGETKFETNNANIYRDDDLVSQDDLRIGMLVTVEGTYDEDDDVGYAEKIIYDKTLKGPITHITINATEPATKVLEIMGQQVIVKKGETKFENTSFEDLAEGMLIEVSGYFDSSDAIQATYIEKESDDFDSDHDEIEIEGYLSELDMDERTFMLNGYLVNYRHADFGSLSPFDLEDGMFVEVEGLSLIHISEPTRPTT